MAGKKSKSSGDTLKDAAREIGSRLGEVKAHAARVVEGVKAAVKASTDRYKASPKAKRATPAPKAKKKSSRGSK